MVGDAVRESRSAYITTAHVVTNLPALVRDARERLDLNQRETATYMGVSQGSVWRIETGLEISAFTLRQALSWLERVESWENLSVSTLGSSSAPDRSRCR